MAKPPANVLIADSQLLFARSLAACLGKNPSLVLAGTPTTSGLETVKAAAALEASGKCDLILMDYWIAGMRASTATAILLNMMSSKKVVLLGWFHTAFQVSEAFSAGASAFVSKSAGYKPLVEVITRVLEGESALYAPDASSPIEAGVVSAKQIDPALERFLTLTPREIEVLSLLSFGPVEKVAKRMSISLGTLRNHVYNILRKTHTRSQVEAIDVARTHGLIDA